MRAMSRGAAGPVAITGEGRDLAAAGAARPVRVELDEAGFSLTLDGSAPIRAGYRDLATIAVDQGRVLLVVGEGRERLLIERLGAALGTLVGELRARRARQQLADRFIDVPPDDAIELVEYRAIDEGQAGPAAGEHGIAQLAYHAWGAALLPLDERSGWRLMRRGRIADVSSDQARGAVSVRMAATGSRPATSIELVGLGLDAEKVRARLAGLRAQALADAAAIVGTLLPDAPYDLRQRAGSLLVDGQPISAEEFGDGWPTIESAVLSEPTFAASYRALRERAGAEAPSWLALAPRRPASADDQMAWFFVALPGNLLAFELVSAGAHATYLFRALPAARYAGEGPAQLRGPAMAVVEQVSEALVDARFLREPIHLPAERLSDARYLRYRLAIAALPSLAAAQPASSRWIRRPTKRWRAAASEGSAAIASR